MEPRIKCAECGREFDAFNTAVAHVEAEHPEIP